MGRVPRSHTPGGAATNACMATTNEGLGARMAQLLLRNRVQQAVYVAARLGPRRPAGWRAEKRRRPRRCNGLGREGAGKTLTRPGRLRAVRRGRRRSLAAPPLAELLRTGPRGKRAFALGGKIGRAAGRPARHGAGHYLRARGEEGSMSFAAHHAPYAAHHAGFGPEHRRVVATSQRAGPLWSGMMVRRARAWS
jgi:hypothetical protein